MSSSRKRGARQAKDTAAIAVQAPAGANLAGGERASDFTWGGTHPVYRCHAREGCTFERMDNLPAVVEHELLHEETRTPPSRESAILDKDGKPLKVEGE